MWSEQGYFVLAPNPRGSFGQGEAVTAANRKDFGYGDLRDILKGMDAVEAKVSIDTHREGLTGWSYGGFMTMFAVTQTHRFRAAVAGAGISDWLS
jgi:dipeptidyl aminopeptidase/acylaminoacyl peptidase